VRAAAEEVAARFGIEPPPLYGIVNNAGLGTGQPTADILQVNVFGARRVTEAFLPLLDPCGRIVNVSSAAGPVYVNRCGGELARLFVDPRVTWSQLAAVMEPHLRDRTEQPLVALSTFADGAYGLSKACLNAYTMIVAREHPNLSVNACTPGFCATDMT
jgi:NAD(P)-dependent dehydrogenase (short-subunit alcohol dehydrogenase family)